MFARMFQIENTKLFKSRLFWVELALLTAFVVLLFAGLFAIGQFMPNEGLEEHGATVYWPTSLPNAVGFASGGGLGGLLIMVLTSVIVAQGYSHRTFSLWLGRGTPRMVVVLAQFAALALAATLFVVVATLVGGFVSALITLAMEGSLALGAVDYVQLGLSILRTAYTLLPYVALTMLFAVLTRSAAGALGLGVGYALLVESVLMQLLMLVGEFGGKIARFLPAMLARSVDTLNSAIVPGQDAAVVVNAPMSQVPIFDPAAAAIGIALYTLVFIGLAVWKFRRQDLTA